MRLLAAIVLTALVSSGVTVAIRPEAEPCPEPVSVVEKEEESFNDWLLRSEWLSDLRRACRTENLYDHNPDRLPRCLAEAYTTPLPK